MNRVIVKSVHGAFGYVMEHYYPFGMEVEAAEQGSLTDTYAYPFKIVTLMDLELSLLKINSVKVFLRCYLMTLLPR